MPSCNGRADAGGTVKLKREDLKNSGVEEKMAEYLAGIA
jgi:hypothetical protein